MTDLLSELEAVVGLYRVASDMAPGAKSRQAIHEADAAAADFITGHRAEIAAAVRDAETLRRVKAMRDEWERDEREHLVTFGQHLPASVICLVEKLDTAMRAGEGQG